MDQKRELSSIDLAALVTELNRYEGAKVDKAYLYDDDLLRLKLRDFDRGRVELMIEVGISSAPTSRIPSTSRTRPAARRTSRRCCATVCRAPTSRASSSTSSTGSHVRVRARGREHDARRRAVRAGERRRARRDRRGRRVAVDGSAQISDGRARRAVRVVPCLAAQPLDVSLGGFKRHMRESDSDVVRTLATQLNLGGLYAEEVYPRRRREGNADRRGDRRPAPRAPRGA